jgi:SAM-dependent methyltransferase
MQPKLPPRIDKGPRLDEKFIEKLTPERISGRLKRMLTPPYLKNKGYCPTCDSKVTFIANNSHLRDHYVCNKCGSIPRERALMTVIEMFYPNWQDLIIHESSPGARGASARLAAHCKGYLTSQFFPGQALGALVDGMRNENLEAMTFADESADLLITQDVMEHIFNPSKTWQEIARTLKPGGAHIFTTPLVNKMKPSATRANLDENGQIVHVLPPVYHLNPINAKGSLVTVDWGFDICQYIFAASGLFTQIIYIEDISRGIRAEINEVLVTFKV